jgi:small subunit ribosomal protein S9
MTDEKKIKKKKGKRRTGINTKAKKKNAVARAVIREGTGKVTINKQSLDCIKQKYVYELIRDPLRIAGELANRADIEVSANGGGFMGQAVAVRAAIAKALVKFSNDQKLREKFLNYDRMLLVDDVRRVEPKKPLGKKARKKKQKSKR